MQSLEQSKIESWLSWFFKGLLVLVGMVFFGRLFELQVIKGEYYRDMSDNNRVRRVAITAPRGKIYARGGEVLVDNTEVTKTVKFDPKSGYEKIDATDESAETDKFNEWKREYKLGWQFAHVAGYLGEVNENEVGKVDPNCQEKGPRTLGSLIGRSGLEQYYDCLLKGTDGEELVEVNTFGEKIRLIGRKSPVEGQDLHTTIDAGLQKKLAEIMKDYKGAAIATDASGEVLAMFSSPSYDPNNLSEAVKNPDQPLFNRVISGTYHPGSVFKMVSATAFLENDVVDRSFMYNDTGIIFEGNGEYSYRNWYYTQYGGTEGEIDLATALARSTDTFFYEMGAKTGIKEMVRWSKEFGLGELTNIDLPGEVVGLVPSPEWKMAVKGERWFLGNTYHYSIGQGDLSLTPSEAHRIAVVIANGGKLCDLQLNIDKDSNCKDLGIKPDHVEYIKQGMIGACAEGGTAFPFFDFTPQVACKTGTAQTNEEDKTHAWFTVFAPADNPQIVFTVLVEKGGEGSKDAAPLARELFDYWNREQNP